MMSKSIKLEVRYTENLTLFNLIDDNLSRCGC